jgi:hypothetical protein
VDLPARGAIARRRSRSKAPKHRSAHPRDPRHTPAHPRICTHRSPPRRSLARHAPLCTRPDLMHSRDASLFAIRRSDGGRATRADAPRACAHPLACVDNALPLDEASLAAPPARTRSRNTRCRDRTGCRSSPSPRSPGTYTADSFPRAPPPTRHPTLDKSVRRAHNIEAVLATTRTAPKAWGPTVKSSPGPSPQLALRKRIANIANAIAQQRQCAPSIHLVEIPLSEPIASRAYPTATGLISPSNIGLVLESASEQRRRQGPSTDRYLPYARR